MFFVLCVFLKPLSVLGDGIMLILIDFWGLVWVHVDGNLGGEEGGRGMSERALVPQGSGHVAPTKTP